MYSDLASGHQTEFCEWITTRRIDFARSGATLSSAFNTYLKDTDQVFYCPKNIQEFATDVHAFYKRFYAELGCGYMDGCYLRATEIAVEVNAFIKQYSLDFTVGKIFGTGNQLGWTYHVAAFVKDLRTNQIFVLDNFTRNAIPANTWIGYFATGAVRYGSIHSNWDPLEPEPRNFPPMSREEIHQRLVMQSRSVHTASSEEIRRELSFKIPPAWEIEAGYLPPDARAAHTRERFPPAGTFFSRSGFQHPDYEAYIDEMRSRAVQQIRRPRPALRL